MPFQLPELSFLPDALAANGMSRETVEIHHGLHHKAYVDNGNKAISGTEWEGRPLDDIVRGTYQPGAVAQSAIFNNASQHWNHTHFWEVIAPGGNGMSGDLERALMSSFGSVEMFKAEFAATGVSQFGSGWVWLVRDGDDGSLKVVKTENGVNPLCLGHQALLGCDVWEHSYYIDFRNRRPAYLDNFLGRLVNWDVVAGRL